MWNKLKRVADFIQNMGWRYIGFRLWHVFQVKSGVFKKKFPANVPVKHFITLEAWRAAHIPFLIASREALEIPKHINGVLASRFRESVKNNITFFNSQQLQLQQVTQWSVNPSNGYAYDMTKHWSQIADLSVEAGDIKFVWEKARFSYLYDILRYDYHSGTDQAAFVFNEIEDFIDNNPINLGPQYKCSQEISLRVLNWTYALHYYKNSAVLTAPLFDKIMNAMYWQLRHVRHNIHFARIAVRNNHAITECLMLYLSGLLFPFMPETAAWSKAGKTWFEQEVAHQIYEDGTFLQYSMNYHRVVVQLLTWAVRLNDLNGLRYCESIYQKAQASLEFLDACMDKTSGTLPNYGSNDGALFFKFTDLDYRDYTSQLDDLRMALNGTALHHSESFAWYGMYNTQIITQEQNKLNSFHNGGYYIINEPATKTFLRCGAYKDRPAQADNLHLDIWHQGVNYLWDCGSYKYNTEEKYLKHFSGTAGHNTVTVNGQDQMLKGSRFIWFYWIKKVRATLLKNTDLFEFNGCIEAFRQLGTVSHNRQVTKKPHLTQWNITDTLTKARKDTMVQHWHVNPAVFEKITFTAVAGDGTTLTPVVEEKWYSSYYGVKEKSIAISFATLSDTMHTKVVII